jgi:hypothetical protein
MKTPVKDTFSEGNMDISLHRNFESQQINTDTLKIMVNS